MEQTQKTTMGLLDEANKKLEIAEKRVQKLEDELSSKDAGGERRTINEAKRDLAEAKETQDSHAAIHDRVSAILAELREEQRLQKEDAEG